MSIAPAPQVEMVSELSDNEQTAMELYALVKDAEGDIDMDDPEEIAELASKMLNTVIHLGGIVERFQAALNARAGGDGELVQLLVELREYMHDRADADHDGEKFVGNVEMGLGERIDAALASQAVGVKDGR